jgi:glycosyltransferase involved in cell wall biosynthesis
MIDRLGPAGTETQLVALIRHLNRKRVRPFLCLLDGEDEQSRCLEPDDCPILRLGIRSLSHPRTLWQAWRLARFLRRERIDIFQAYFPESTYLGVPVARLAGVSYVLRTRNNLGHWMTPTHQRLGRLLTRVATGTVANCAASRQAVLADERSPARSVVVLENGVDLERFRAIAPVSHNGRPRCVGALANLRPVKGLDVLLRAAALVGAAHPDVQFRVAGEGDERPSLEQLAAAQGLADRFGFLGSVADVPAFVGGLDVAVLSSWSEGMSNAVLEYMAAGRPIVATAVGATTELIDDGVHGLLVPPGQPERLAGAIDALLRDPVRAARLGAAARRRVEERYSREAMVRTFEDFYVNLAGGRIRGL